MNNKKFKKKTSSQILDTIQNNCTINTLNCVMYIRINRDYLEQRSGSYATGVFDWRQKSF